MSRPTTAPVPAREDADPVRPGRRRDPQRDIVILDSALSVLAEAGYDGMTIDAVAARAGMARATVYRRWSSKAALLLAAVAHLTDSDVDSGALPDTGTLRGDMIATIAPDDEAAQDLRINVLTSLLALSKVDPDLAHRATGAGLGPWVEVNRALMRRAVERGEFAGADIDTLSHVIPMMCLGRAVQNAPITRAFSLSLIDGVIIPAMRGGHLTHPGHDTRHQGDC